MAKGKATMRGLRGPCRAPAREVHMALKLCDSQDLLGRCEEMFSSEGTALAGSDRGKFTACWSSKASSGSGRARLRLKVKKEKGARSFHPTPSLLLASRKT
jgi:hypothetical protein